MTVKKILYDDKKNFIVSLQFFAEKIIVIKIKIQLKNQKNYNRNWFLERLVCS